MGLSNNKHLKVSRGPTLPESAVITAILGGEDAANFGVDPAEANNHSATLRRVNPADSLRPSHLELAVDTDPGPIANHLVLGALNGVIKRGRNGGRELRRMVVTYVNKEDSAKQEWARGLGMKEMGVRGLDDSAAHAAGTVAFISSVEKLNRALV